MIISFFPMQMLHNEYMLNLKWIESAPTPLKPIKMENLQTQLKIHD